MTPKAIKRERARMKRAGFRGRPFPEAVWTFTGDRTHYLAIRMYELPGVGDVEPEKRPYLESWETHDRQGRARITPVRDVVHLMQNLESHEIALACARKARP